MPITGCLGNQGLLKMLEPEISRNPESSVKSSKRLRDIPFYLIEKLIDVILYVSENSSGNSPAKSSENYTPTNRL